MKKMSGPIQIIGIISALLVILMYLNYLVQMSAGHNWTYWLNPVQDPGSKALFVPFLMMPILLFKLLFEGDESPIGKFLFRIGDRLYQWIYAIYAATIRRYVKGTRVDLTNVDSVKMVDLKEDRKSLRADQDHKELYR